MVAEPTTTPARSGIGGELSDDFDGFADSSLGIDRTEKSCRCDESSLAPFLDFPRWRRTECAVELDHDLRSLGLPSPRHEWGGVGHADRAVRHSGLVVFLAHTQ